MYAKLFQKPCYNEVNPWQEEKNISHKNTFSMYEYIIIDITQLIGFVF